MNPGNPNKILSKFKVLLRVFCPTRCAVPSSQSPFPQARKQPPRLRSGLQDGSCWGWGWLAGGELRGTAEMLRQANADHPGQWQSEAEEAPPSPGGRSRPRQVANSIPRLPLRAGAQERPGP